jgi:hypothetical protein
VFGKKTTKRKKKRGESFASDVRPKAQAPSKHILAGDTVKKQHNEEHENFIVTVKHIIYQTEYLCVSVF